MLVPLPLDRIGENESDFYLSYEQKVFYVLSVLRAQFPQTDLDALVYDYKISLG